MAETNSQARDRITREFETMKSLELSAHDLYTRIATDRSVEPQKVRNAFSTLAKEERQHADIVQEIINIVANAL